MPHHCDRHFELWPEYWKHVYVECKEDESGRFIFKRFAGESLVVYFCPICGMESPAHKSEQGVFDAHPFTGTTEYPEVKTCLIT